MKAHNNKSSGGENFADMLAAIGTEAGETANTEEKTAQAVPATDAAAPETDITDETNAAVEASAELPLNLAALGAPRPQIADKPDTEIKASPDDGKPAANDNDSQAQQPVVPAPLPQQQPVIAAPLQAVTAAPQAPQSDGTAAPAINEAAPRAAQPQAPAPQPADEQADDAAEVETAAAPQGADKPAAKPAPAKPAKPAEFKSALEDARPASARTDTAKTDPAPAQNSSSDNAQPAKPAEAPAQPAPAAHNANPQPDALPVSAPVQAATNTAANMAHEIAAPAPHHAPDLDKLAVEIAARSQAGAKQFDIRLDPPELGRVDVRLSIDATGKAQAHLTADQPQTLDLLRKDSTNLTQALRDAGLDVNQDGLNFSLRQQQHQAGHDQPAHGRHVRVNFAAPAAIETIATPAASRGSALGLLDIRV